LGTSGHDQSREGNEKMRDRIKLGDMARRERKPLTHIENQNLMPLKGGAELPNSLRCV
jgi:hypothetical protein